MSSAGLIIFIIFYICFLLFFTSINLKTTLKEEGIYISFFPFFNKKFYEWDKIKAIKVEKYSLNGEYLGWGYRIGVRGTAYTISGNKAIKIKFKNGKRLLIGT
ncbi:hypothetical protein GNY06_10955 [Elizabethkingia argentiflava]|uniref:Uncharacterized protein n=1 Tax=Elizabethkingia argenteiflava TaxID=2681556 RepID=A0A845PUG9_9FLAO|nr:hypothetical protein [Elizabethkingia argenteiflava]NAW51859.1 hypothetical protein [Elizabethkingia argenteiflava]